MKNNTKNHQTNSKDTLATDVIAQAKERAEYWHKDVADFMSCHQTALMSCL